jgi:hypothetical protein
MISLAPRRRMATLAFGLVGFLAASAPPTASPAGPRSIDPASVLPLDKIPPQHRDAVVEVIRDHTMHRKGEPDTFPCHSKVYLSLLNEPAITLALWQDLAASPVKLKQVDFSRYQGTDGAGATATWEYLVRSPKLHVLLSDLDYVSPRGYYKETNGDPWISHEVEVFVKIDSKGWKALAKTVRPLLDKVLEDQVQEAGWFVSLMGRMVETYPNWASGVVAKQEQIDVIKRKSFQEIIVLSRRPNASAGRPQLAENDSREPVRRR